MEKLLAYINGLPILERDAFCDRCGTTQGYMRKACSLGQILNPITCSVIERESSGSITRKDLRPDDYWLIWPEIDDRHKHAA